MLLVLASLAAADPPALKVGGKAPNVDAIFADGSPYDNDHVKGKFVLVTWQLNEDEAAKRHSAAMRKLRKEFVDEKRLQMMTVRFGGEFDKWLLFQEKQPPHDPNYPMRAFYSDSKWWQAFHHPGADGERNPFRVGKKPVSFLIGSDGKLLVVDIPDDKIAKTIKEALVYK